MSRFAIGATLTGLLMGSLLAVSAPASAEPAQIAGRGDCDLTEYCVYEDAGGRGGIVAVAGNIPDYDLWIFVYQGSGSPHPSPLNDRVTSWRNHGQNAGATVIHSYRDSHQRNEIWVAPIGGLVNAQPWQNDIASSHNWQRS